MRAAILVALAAAAAALTGRFELSTVGPLPSGWSLVSRAEPATTIPFVVALRQQNLDVLDQKFWDVSTPGRPQYGQFLTTDEVNALVASSPADMNAALSVFNGQAGVSCSPFFDALKCQGTVAAIEALFHTQLNVYTNPTMKRTATVYSVPLTLPAALEGVVELVEGFTRFPYPGQIATKRVGKPNAADYVIVPEGLSTLAALAGAKGSDKVIQAPVEFASEGSYTPSELTTFAKETGVPDIVVAKKIGPFAPSGDPESSLDIQYIASVGHSNTNWFITETDWLYTFAIQWANRTDHPSVMSMSYGWYEGDQCSVESDPKLCKNSYDYVERVNTEFQKIGARGISLLASSGDSGAHGRTDPDCQYKVLRPAFPAASPYVTAVGATQIKLGSGKTGGTSKVCSTGTYKDQCAVSGTQIVCSPSTGALIASGGGFSNVAARPDYQKDVVAKYLASKTTKFPAKGDFNETSRGFPDVAALGHNYFIEAGGPGLVDGTSCSAPVWGGIIGLLNAYLISHNKPVLGFANPTLYKIYETNPKAFIDITEGDNTCTEDTCSCSPGFYAAPGWDATTGLGAPNFALILKTLETLKA